MSRAQHSKAPRLVVGDACVLMHGTSLYECEVADVRVNLEGDPLEFAMYLVKSRECSKWFEDQSQHRSDLFKMPGERPALIARLEDDIDMMQQLLREQEREQEDEDEAAIPHGATCPCETCQMERAADTACEPRRS